MTTSISRQEAIYNRLAKQALPGIQTLSARDFKVCEDCGGPAMLHPRFEIAQSVSGEKAVLCCSCLHQKALSPDKRVHRLGDQLWRCCVCGFVRAWGWMHPYDSGIKPALGCGQCMGVTRHRFVRVA